MIDKMISVENISKRYRIGNYTSGTAKQGSLIRSLASPFNYLISTLREPPEDEIIWALTDVTFHVKQGEVMGVIGHNGAGKSTLLKILSRITEPTRGRALIHGRVGSLLEVGTGFHPELTGRENIFLNGAILGMKRAEIDRKFDEIVNFADVEKFIDTPVKRYSSGMYVRLAFAVAAHLETEILLIDEVLAVGDASFQERCLGKMGDVAQQGRTILFVSHNLVALQNLCHQAVWLDHGKVMEVGMSGQVVRSYLQASTSRISQTEKYWDDLASAPGNDDVRIRSVRIYAEDGKPSDLLDLQTPLTIEVEYWNCIPDARLHVTLHVYTEQHIVAFTSGSVETDIEWASRPHPVGLFRSVCHIPPNLLNTGLHRVLLLVVKNSDTIIFRHEDILSFSMLDLEKRPGSWYGKEPGAVRPRLDWKTEYLGEVHWQ
jgi:lipopolysaccharide transport system ATP-binding protein